MSAKKIAERDLEAIAEFHEKALETDYHLSYELGEKLKRTKIPIGNSGKVLRHFHTEEGEDRRWTSAISEVFVSDESLEAGVGYSLVWESGLTEYQEDEEWDGSVEIVKLSWEVKRTLIQTPVKLSDLED